MIYHHCGILSYCTGYTPLHNENKKVVFIHTSVMSTKSRVKKFQLIEFELQTDFHTILNKRRVYRIALALWDKSKWYNLTYLFSRYDPYTCQSYKVEQFLHYQDYFSIVISIFHKGQAMETNRHCWYHEWYQRKERRSQLSRITIAFLS